MAINFESIMSQSTARVGDTVTVNTEFIDNRAEILRQMRQNATAFQMAAGLKAVELILDQMNKGYSTPVRDTGDLMRDVNFQVDGEKVIVGNSLNYAMRVHDGTRFMSGRPYIKDALTSSKGKQELESVGASALKRGFTQRSGSAIRRF